MHAPAQTKRCSRCGKVKLLTEFDRDATRRDGRHAYCRECHRAAARARTAARVAAGRCRQNGCPHMAEPGRAYCADHLAAKRARRRERVDAGLCRDCGEPAAPGRRRCSEHLAYRRAWRKRNVAQGYCKHGPGHGPATHGVLCAKCAARRVAKYRRVMTEYTAILADQGVDHDGRCELCGLAEATQVDHVLPRTLGGVDDDPLLLRWVCATCNASRGANTSWVPALTAWDVEEQLSREEDR